MKKILCFLLLMVFMLAIPLSAGAEDNLVSPPSNIWNFKYNQTVPGPMKTALRNQLGTDYRPILFVATSTAPGGPGVVIVEHKNALYTVNIGIYPHSDLLEGADRYTVIEGTLKAFFEGNQQPGGWTVAGKKKLPAELAPAYKALLGKSFLPMLHCGTQVVGGTNYTVLCMSRTKIFTAVIHIGLDGKYSELKGQRKNLLTEGLLNR